MNTLLLAILLGLAFGAALERVGAANPDVLLRMLTLRDMHLAKTILLGIGLASSLMFAGLMLGVVDVDHMSVKTTYLGVLIGGVIFGLGWALTGFCPGTGVAALGTLRKDAVAFVLGGLGGAVLYSLTYPLWKSSGLLDGEKLTTGAIDGSGAEGLLSLSGQLAGLVLGLIFVVVAFLVPRFPFGRPIEERELDSVTVAPGERTDVRG